MLLLSMPCSVMSKNLQKPHKQIYLIMGEGQQPPPTKINTCSHPDIINGFPDNQKTPFPSRVQTKHTNKNAFH